MIDGLKVAVVMPAYNAEQTLERTVAEVPALVDDIILVDDGSSDRTAEVARGLGLHTLVHPENRGYGGNRRPVTWRRSNAAPTSWSWSTPTTSTRPSWCRPWPTAWPAACTTWRSARGSWAAAASRAACPKYKYVANRFLTLVENLLIGEKLSEHHTGYRAFSRRLLRTLPLEENDDNFVFDNQMLVQAVHFGFKIAEVTCPTKYFAEASSIGFSKSVRYGFGVLGAAVQFRLTRWGLAEPRFLSAEGRKLI
jgi:glycosyltransferase involved in cell wall biosynthesis